MKGTFAYNGVPQVTPWFLRLFGKPIFRYPVYSWQMDHIYFDHWEYI